MPRTRPMINRGGALDGIVDDSKSEIENLKDELQEWMDSLSSNNMEHMPKYEELSEAVDMLENAINNDPSIPDNLLPGMENFEYHWQEKAPYKGAQSRSDRCSAAVSDLNNVMSYLEDKISEAHALEDADLDLIGEWKQYVNDIQMIIDEAEQVSFPGMY